MAIGIDATLYLDFTTVDPYTGAPTNADSGPTPIIYEDAQAATPTAMGSTVTSRGVAGEYFMTIVTSAANGFEVGKVYNARILATVNSIADNFTMFSFSVAAASTSDVNVTQWLGTAVATPTVAGVPEVDMTHMAGGVQTVTDLKDFADAGYDPATNKVQGVVLVDTTTVATDAEADIAALNDFDPTNDAVANVTLVGTTTDSTNAEIAIAALNDFDPDNDTVALVTAVTNLSDLIIRAGTAQAGGATTITLDAGASATNDLYNGAGIIVTGGTGAGQVRPVSDYVGATKVATISPAWATNPDVTSTFIVTGTGSGTSSGGGDATEANQLLMMGATFATGTDSLEAIRDRGDAAWVTGSTGSGATAFTYTLTDTDFEPAVPIADVHVWATTDGAGANVVVSGYTNDSGQVTFYLDSGTKYYLWRKKSGVTFDNPDSETV